MQLGIHSKPLTNLLVIQNLPMYTEMLKQVLSSEEDIHVIGASSTLGKAESMMRNQTPNIILTDLTLSDGSAIDWAREIKQKHPDVRIIFLTSSNEHNVALSAISIGAEGYLLKNISCQSLSDAIRAVASGQYVYDPAITSSIVRRVAQIYPRRDAGTRIDSLDDLSPRERDVAMLVAQGLTNKEIAAAMFLSVNTVKTHVRRIFERLGISSRRDLTKLARQEVPYHMLNTAALPPIIPLMPQHSNHAF